MLGSSRRSIFPGSSDLASCRVSRIHGQRCTLVEAAELVQAAPIDHGHCGLHPSVPDGFEERLYMPYRNVGANGIPRTFQP
jgi:hypothetical protein